MDVEELVANINPNPKVLEKVAELHESYLNLVEGDLRGLPSAGLRRECNIKYLQLLNTILQEHVK